MTNDKIISASILRLRMKSPFFATLALFARFVPTSALPTVATDGRDVFYNPEFFTSLPPLQVDGLLLHAVLHAALLHIPRRGTRDRKCWNMAADIVVNGIIADRSGCELPPGEIRDSRLEQLSVEEIYELLLQKTPVSSKLRMDLLYKMGKGSEAEDMGSKLPQNRDFSTSEKGKSENSEGQTEGQETSSQLSEEDSWEGNLDDLNLDSLARKAALEAHWKAAIQKAIAIDRSTNSQGTLPAGLLRQLGEITEPQLDWQSYLWRYLVRTPTDFTGFDRRFIGRGLYLDTLDGESV